MAYDSTEFTEALEPPAITVQRGRLGQLWRRWANRLPGVDLEVETKTYEGRLLSAREWWTWRDRLEALEEAPEEEALETVRRFLLTIDIPPSVVLNLPPGAMQEAMLDFFEALATAAGAEEGEIADARAAVPGREPPQRSDTPSGSRTGTEAEGVSSR